ncbi:aromatic acid exporter family protein [Sporosarcina sp. PTS2304]|uniref:aromatic acid exporter family protein n=1 Tax=Sporosarcina sp. PTS2304 TaxID=2283194 RepID=UPI000E0D4480|nr:aromatic acid exporter family protein [Sporosarcina sp. PTS2304]AXH99148.1 aromatic acid exporter family protein [Sporosarcina sp. PTS2304]
MRSFHFNGGRIVKTGLAIFLTAVICEWFHWQPVFAVITAIVTIEPTVSDSIKKGIVRFPASAIGSGFAVFFIALFGNSPITYTLAAVCTILVCYRLKLHAGLLVATLTAVAMVEVIHSNYLIAFFIRLGTTTTGLLVSTAVNMLVFPPSYKKDIVTSMERIGQQASTILHQTFTRILYGKQTDEKESELLIQQFMQEIRKTETLIHFEQNDSKLYPWGGKKEEGLLLAEKQLLFLHNLEYHIQALLHISAEDVSWTNEECDLLMHAVTDLADYLGNISSDQTHPLHLEKVTQLFWQNQMSTTSNGTSHSPGFPPEFVILYELIALYDVASRLNDHDRPKKHGAVQKVSEN